MLSHLHLAIIIAVVVLLLLVLYVYMNPAIITWLEAEIDDYPIYTLTATYKAGSCTAISNDVAANRTFVTNQTGDGVFYETQPPFSTTYSLAILVIKCTATDYSTAYTKAGGTSTNITSSTTPYVGVLVQYTQPSSSTGTNSRYNIHSDNTAASVSAANWMGAFDMTLLLANAAAVSGFNMNAIGNYTHALPTVNSTASTNATFGTASTVTSWPSAVGTGATLISATVGTGGYGVKLSCTTPAVAVST